MAARTFSAAQMREALVELEFVTGWAGGWRPVWRDYMDERGPCIGYSEAGTAGAGERLARWVRQVDEERSPEITIGLPEPRRFYGEPTSITVLWCRIEGAEQFKRAQWKTMPMPSFVVREGQSSRRLLIWPLEDAIGYAECEDANRRIAYRIGAKQMHGVPENFRCPAPGTCLRVDRARPLPVVVTRMDPAVFSVRQVVGRLKEPPARDAWRQGGAG